MLCSLIIMAAMAVAGIYLDRKLREIQETKEKEARERMEALVEEEIREQAQRSLEDKYRE